MQQRFATSDLLLPTRDSGKNRNLAWRKTDADTLNIAGSNTWSQALPSASNQGRIRGLHPVVNLVARLWHVGNPETWRPRSKRSHHQLLTANFWLLTLRSLFLSYSEWDRNTNVVRPPLFGLFPV